MTIVPDRYNRNLGLFGREGQHKLKSTRVAVVGVSGLGSPLVQQLGLLGIGHLDLIDPDELDDTNRNRFVGARESDPVPGSPKVELAQRLIHEINREVTVNTFQQYLESTVAFERVKMADWVFGCLDHDGPRFVLNELCLAYGIPFIDLASEIHDDGSYGGRVSIMKDGEACLCCLDELDMNDVHAYLSSEEERADLAKIYGVSRCDLSSSGPSVAPLNAVIASHATVEFMAAITNLREPVVSIHYRGDRSLVTTFTNRRDTDCYYCRSIRNTLDGADVQRYLRIPHLNRSVT